MDEETTTLPSLATQPLTLHDRVAIVTGGFGEIGHAIVTHLASLGAKLIISDLIISELSPSLSPTRAAVYKADISDPTQIKSLFDFAESTFNTPAHILINCAGVADPTFASISTTPIEIFDRIISVNTKGSFLCCKEAANRLKRGGGGRIICITSSQVALPGPGYGSYAMSKAAVEVMVKILAKELKGTGITVNCVAPGPIATEMFFAGKTEEMVNNVINVSPLNRLGQTEDVAPVVGFLAGDAGEWINEFTSLRRLKPIFIVDEMPVGFEQKDFTRTRNGFKTINKRKITRLSNYNFNRSTRSTVFATASKSKNVNGKESNAVVDQEAMYDALLGDPDYESDDLSCFRGLVLDISYRPINVVCWKRAICLEFMEKADVLEYYDQTVNSVNGSFYIPAVLRVPHLLQVVKRRRTISMLSRKNILARDNFTCQYCSSTTNLTIDHVLPMSRGGEWKWENLVTACLSCNSKKGDKTLEEANMKLHKTLKAPKDYDIIAIPLTNNAINMLKLRKGTPEEWIQYLGGPSP